MWDPRSTHRPLQFASFALISQSVRWETPWLSSAASFGQASFSQKRSYHQVRYHFVRLLTAIASSWINDRLHECVRRGHRWPSFAIFDCEEQELLNELFRQADSCKSVKDLWQVQRTHVSLYYYSTTVATWFFGLLLIQFRDKPSFRRCLEISG